MTGVAKDRRIDVYTHQVRLVVAAMISENFTRLKNFTPKIYKAIMMPYKFIRIIIIMKDAPLLI